MTDDKIYQLGGDERDVEEYAKNNGSDLTTPMNSLNRDQWKEKLNDLWIEKSEVVSSNGVAFSAIKYKDFIDILTSELEKVRQEAEDNMRKRCVEALPKKKNRNFDIGNQEVPRYENDKDLWGKEYADWMNKQIDSYNSAIDQAIQNINNLDKE